MHQTDLNYEICHLKDYLVSYNYQFGLKKSFNKSMHIYC